MAAAPMHFIDGVVIPADYSAAHGTRSRRPPPPLQPKPRGGGGDGDGSDDGGDGSDGDGANAAGGEDADWAVGVSLGRARRTQKTRLVYVDGHPVLKENM
eukprot:364599-Chlamydomonas_euryale.AAC.3